MRPASVSKDNADFGYRYYDDTGRSVAQRRGSRSGRPPSLRRKIRSRRSPTLAIRVASPRRAVAAIPATCLVR